MKLNNPNQVSIVVFIGTISALLPDISNHPLAVIPSSILLAIKISSSKYKLKFKELPIIFRLWIIYFGIYSLLCSINIFIFGNSYNILESLIFSLIYIIYIIFFLYFDYRDLIKGLIIGSRPMLYYMTFIELPLRFINPSLLSGLRQSIGLRGLNTNSLMGFFEEPSHAPALFILLIAIYLMKIAEIDSLNFRTNKILDFLFLFILLSHLSGSILISFYLPISILILIKFIKYLIIDNKIKLLSRLTSIIFIGLGLLFSINIKWLINKITLTVYQDHSASTRLLSLISGIYDFIKNPIFGNGAGFYRYTRSESIQGIINTFNLNSDIGFFLQQAHLTSGFIESNLLEKAVPVYSLFSYLLSETGMFFLVFIFGYFSLIRIALIYSYNNFRSFNIKSLSYLILGMIPLSYIIYMSMGYPRGLPYLILAQIIVYKKINYDNKQNYLTNHNLQ